MQATKIANILFNPLINTEFIGKNLIYLPQCHSTNDFAVEKCKNQPIENGTIFITSDQTTGKGQRGNKWLSEKNQNLTFSIVVETRTNSLEEVFKYNMLLSCALIDFFNVYDTDFKIKWSNDIYFKTKKLGGILIESITNYESKKNIIIGIGLNINQINFNYLNATSLRNIINKELDLAKMLEVICQKIESYFKLNTLDSVSIIENLYLKNLYQYDVLAKYKTETEMFEGKIKTVLTDGRIGIEKNGKLHFFERKQIVFL